MPTGLLEFSRDPLSDTTPTYIDVSAYLMDATWGDGKHRDLDEPQAGTATFRLRNTDRRFEPEYEAGAYYPDIVPLRRFRLSVDGQPEGVWYATRWDVQYPARTATSVVTVTCVDGFGLLSLDMLEIMSPSSASTYFDVVMHDEPTGYWRLAEARVTKGIKARDSSGNDHTGVYTGFGPRVASEGPPGLQAEGNICYRFDGFDDDVAVPFHTDLNPEPADEFTIEAWANADTFPSATNDRSCIAGSFDESGGAHVAGYGIGLFRGSASTVYWTAHLADAGGDSVVGANLSTNEATLGEWTHIAFTYNNGTGALYVNGARTITEVSLRDSYVANTVEAFRIGRFGVDSGVYEHFDGFLDEVVFFDRALSPDRVLAHYNAGVNAFVEQTAGERITALASSDLWSEAGIQTGSHDVRAVAENGQPKVGEIIAAVKSEMPDSLFYFDGDGDPTYLGWNYKDTSPYNTPAATFGDSGSEVRYQDIALIYDDEIFNEVTINHQATIDGETSHTEMDQDSIDDYRRRAHTESDLLLVHHNDAIAVAAATLDSHKDPKFRVESITLNSGTSEALTQILERQIGDLIRIKRRGEGGTPIDVVTTIIGKSKTLTRDGHMFCTWNTARGFNAAAGVWRLGIVGFSELNTTAVLA